MKKSKNKDFENLPVSIKEFELAWNEFFKNKKRPKNDEEDRKQQKEFMDWYNNVRKQSDTGKTPAEMFKAVYGKEPGDKPKEPSRIMNFEWDEDYKEPDELLQEADSLINKGKYEKALKLVDEVLEIVPNDDESLLLKSEILNYLRRYEESEQYLKKVEKEGNLKAYASFYRSQRYMFEGNFVRAIKYMKEAYEQEPDNFDFLIGLANYLYLENDKYYKEYADKARKLDEKRTEKFLKKSWLEPKEFMKEPFFAAFLESVDTLMNENNAEEAEKNLNWAIMYESYIDKEIVKILRGVQVECLFMQGRVEDALIKVEELIKIDKSNPHAYFYKADILLHQDQNGEALKEVDKCLKAVDKNNIPFPHPDFLMLKSRILKKLDNDEYIYYENKAKELMRGTKILGDAFKEFMKGKKDN